MGVKRSYWDKDNLVQRLCYALNIAEQVIKRLAVSGYTDSEELSVTVRPEKVISETAVLLLAASSAIHIPDVKARIQHLLMSAGRSKV